MLTAIKKTIEEFNNKKISYCHWKSNNNLEKAVNGDTDLDILFDLKQKKEIENILFKNKFTKTRSAWFMKYPYVCDYIAFDEKKGTIIHIHAHYKIVTGKSGEKNQIIPWEKVLLKNRIYNRKYNIYCSDYKDELLLLIIRSCLKLKRLNKVEYSKNNKDTKYAIEEFEWLKKRVSEKELLEHCNTLLNKKSVNSIRKIYINGMNYNRLIQLKNEIKDFIRDTRIRNTLYDYFYNRLRFFFKVLSYFNKKRNKINMINHRALPNKGLIVAFVGADGSGKSTQTKLIRKKISKKLDVHYEYMGSGKGPVSWHRFLLNLVIKGLGLKKYKKDYTKKETKTNKKKKINILTIGKILYAYSLAKEKEKKLKRISKRKKIGKIIICDRYPQTNILGYNDGPLITDFTNTNKRWLDKIANKIYKKYALSEQIKPDLVVKLIANPKVLKKRRPNMDIEKIVLKQNSIKNTSFSPKKNELIVDASLPIDKVTEKIMSEIGKKISKN
ncbi:MAG: hypothetical protein ACMXX8_03200 [Candidatus Woesearchaeota archaeon]